MFSCKDCKKKYRTKPNYCDCGNDTFDEINKIPNIDAFWIDTPIVVHQKIIAPQKQTVIQPVVIQPAVLQPVYNTNRFVKTKTKKIKKQPQIPAKTKGPSGPEQRAQIPPKPQSKVNTKVKTVSKPKLTPNLQTSTKYSEELYRYKTGLRRALFANLSVTSIQGEGKCGIEFSIDKNGKLTNRAFTFQSDNRSVNDEVYKMLMNMPNYYAPPKAYKGEKIKLIFEFDNGSYIINYTDS